jgi:hypothetical protein
VSRRPPLNAASGAATAATGPFPGRRSKLESEMSDFGFASDRWSSPALGAGCEARRIDRVRPWAGSAVRSGAGQPFQHAGGHAGGRRPRAAPILLAESRQ